MTDQTAEPLHPHARDLDPPATGLSRYPPVERWDDWEEYDAKAWPKRVPAALLADPHHLLQLRGGLRAPRLRGQADRSRSRSSRAIPSIRAAAAATAPRARPPSTRCRIPSASAIRSSGWASAAEGKWERVTWDEALDDIAGRIRSRARRGQAARRSCITSAGRATSSCISSGCSTPGASTATTATPTSAPRPPAPATPSGTGFDRPSPDHANARFILLLSSHLEAGHYFNPHAQRIIEGKMAGRQGLRDRHAPEQHRLHGRLLAVAVAGDGGRAAPRLRATCSLREGTLRPRVRAPLGQLGGVPARGAAGRARQPSTSFVRALGELYAEYTPAFAEKESGRPRRHASRRWRARSAARAAALVDAMSGATPRRATSAAGRSRARSSCWSS